MNQKKYFPVHWQNGMKLNKDVFIQQSNALEQLSQYGLMTTLHPNNYGLFGSKKSFDIHISTDQQAIVTVRINELKAGTIGGHIIDIVAGNYHPLDTLGFHEFQVHVTPSTVPQKYWLVLGVDASKTQALHHIDVTGAADFATCHYSYYLQLSAQDGSFVLPPNAIVIGSCMHNGATLSLQEHFVPAMTTVMCHEDMYEWYLSLLKIVENIAGKSISIVAKVRQKNQQTDLSQLVVQLCQNIVGYLQVTLPRLTLSAGNIPPIVLYEAIAGLALVVKQTLDMNIGVGKEELMNYLAEWLSMTPGILEDTCISAAYIKVDVIDHNNNIANLSHFLSAIHSLFETLEKLDFIGKRKDNGLFIKEEPTNSSTLAEEVSPKTKRRFFGY